MNTVALTVEPFFPSVSRVAKPSALRSLMQMWEDEAVPEEEESEAELMVMLSGMVSPLATALDD